MSDVPDAGKWTDRYAIVGEIGRGGMSTVYRATDLRIGNDVAVKVLRREIATLITSKRFAREIRIATQLEHPNIVPVMDSGEFAGLPFFVMPLIAGESLHQRLQRERELSISDTIRFGTEIASALAYAHKRGVVHRDVKPSNIMLADDHALVMDFGIARHVSGSMSEQLTESGETIGTAYYMSPEQGSASGVDGRGDVYSLGCVLYEMLAGVPPFTGSSTDEILRRHRLDDVPALSDRRASVPELLELAVRTSLAKLPADRYADAGEFGVAIERASGKARWLHH